jgi:hypothetical protein
MIFVILALQLALAEWTDSSRKLNYMQCLHEVPDYQAGFLQDPLLAHDVCVCVVEKLEEHLPHPDDAAIIKFLGTDIEKFYPCRDEYQRRKKPVEKVSLSEAQWTVPQRKNFYLFCIETVAKFEEGKLADPLTADGYCRCLTDILETFLDKPTNGGIISFANSPQAKLVTRCPGSTPIKP